MFVWLRYLGILLFIRKELRDFDADRLLMLAGEIVGRFRLELMVRFVMVLSEVGVALHDPVWSFFTPEAEAFEDSGTFKFHLSGGAVGGLDNSPPDFKRHFKYNHKELAVVAVRIQELFCGSYLGRWMF